MEGVNRNINNQAIELRIQIEQAKLGRDLTDEEKQDIVNAQLARPASQAAARARATTAPAQLGPRGEGFGGLGEQQPPPDEDSSSVSSDWDDWQDAGYIEEQRRALQDFSKKQRDIRTAHAKKKKKKGKKKKRGLTGGDALDMEVGDDVSAD